MYVPIIPKICIHSPLKEHIVHFSSNLLKSTEGSHKLALDLASNSVEFFMSHDFPYYISQNAIGSIENLMNYGDKFGTFIMYLYFTLMQVLNTPC